MAKETFLVVNPQEGIISNKYGTKIIDSNLLKDINAGEYIDYCSDTLKVELNIIFNCFKKGIPKFISAQKIKGLGKSSSVRWGERLLIPSIIAYKKNNWEPLGKEVLDTELEPLITKNKNSYFAEVFFSGAGFNANQVKSILKNRCKNNDDCIQHFISDPWSVLKLKGVSAGTIINYLVNHVQRDITADLELWGATLLELTYLYVAVNKSAFILLQDFANYVRGYFKNLNQPSNAVKAGIQHLAELKKIVVVDNKYIIPHKYCETEEKIAAFVARLPNCRLSYNLHPLPDFLSFQQGEVIKNTLKNRISFIIGGAGRGKTTVLSQIIFQLLGEGTIYLAAPTGKAVSRLKNVIIERLGEIPAGIKISTVAALIYRFKEEKLKDFSALILDECFMIDSKTFQQLGEILQMTGSSRLIMVGDDNQLNPVNIGNPLNDIKNSGYYPVHPLMENFRSTGKGIEAASQSIIKGMIPSMMGDGWQYINCSPEKGLIIKLVERFIEQHGLEAITRLQLLSPIYNGPCGIDSMNELLQERFNPAQEYAIIKNRKFKKNDRVIYLKNDPELNIANGDEGYVSKILDNDRILVSFYESEVEFSDRNIGQLTLGWCLSIHKSQGSEFDFVITMLPESSRVILDRKIINTAITRAKKVSVLIGSAGFINRLLRYETGDRKNYLEYALKKAMASDLTP